MHNLQVIIGHSPHDIPPPVIQGNHTIQPECLTAGICAQDSDCSGHGMCILHNVFENSKSHASYVHETCEPPILLMIHCTSKPWSVICIKDSSTVNWMNASGICTRTVMLDIYEGKWKITRSVLCTGIKKLPVASCVMYAFELARQARQASFPFK